MKIEIWSDIVCPWCYIGKRRFEAALRQFPHRDSVDIIWRSFELDPYAPSSSSGSLHEVLAAKLGRPVSEARAMNERVTEMARGEGLDYRLDEARHGNTFDAHRLIHLAAEQGLQSEAKERLLRGYFSEGMAVGEHSALIEALAEVGVDPERASRALAGDDFADAVRADERRAQRLGAGGVPFFVFDEKYGVSGAQAPELFLEVLEKAWSESKAISMVSGSAEAGANCDDGSCSY